MGTTPGRARSARNRTEGRIRPRRAAARAARARPLRVFPRRPSDSPDETSGVENSGRVECGFEPAHQVERAGRRLVEKIQFRSERRRRREQPQMAMRDARRRAPSSESLARVCRANVAADKNLRDAASGMRAKLRAQAFDASAEFSRSRRELGGERGGRKFEIAQLLVGLDGARAFAEGDAVKRSEIIAKMLALILKLGGITGESRPSAQMLPDGRSVPRAQGSTLRACTNGSASLSLSAAPKASAARANGATREGVAFGNRTHLEGRFGDYSERAERSGHHLHQIIAGHVFDHPAAAMHRRGLRDRRSALRSAGRARVPSESRAGRPAPRRSARRAWLRSGSRGSSGKPLADARPGADSARRASVPASAITVMSSGS